MRRLLFMGVTCVCLLASCGTSQTLSGASPADPSLSPLPSVIGRDAAIDIVRARRENVGRIDRIEAKLLTLQDYYDVAGPLKVVAADPKASPHSVGTIGVTGDADKRMLWVVAVSGEVWPQGREPVFWGMPPYPSATPYRPYRWGLFVVDATRAALTSMADAGSDEDWPPIFAQLPDHPAVLGVVAPADPCATLLHIPDVPNVSRFPAKTLADLQTNLPQDFAWMRLLQRVSGVQPNPMQDPRVPRCRVDLLQLGAPYFARGSVPSAAGRWFVPLEYQGAVLLTAFVEVDVTGYGVLGGNRGGAIPVPTEQDARRAAALPNDPVVSAELILARPPGCGSDPTAVWRLVRASGTAVYFALDVLGGTPPGVLFEEKDMRFSSGSISPRAASLSRAC